MNSSGEASSSAENIPSHTWIRHLCGGGSAPLGRLEWASVKSLPWRGYAAVLGGFLLQFTMGAFYSFGNMSTYLASYMRQTSAPNITYTDFVVVQSVYGITQGCFMPLSGLVIRTIGEKASMIIGTAIYSGGCALTYVTIEKELWMVAATYGFVSAFGKSMALIPTLTTGMKWFPKNKGTAMGLVVGGYGGGALVFTNIQTAILNPDNVDVSREGPDKGYFTDAALLGRVPNLLLILSGIYMGMGMLACLLINQPPVDWIQRQAKADSTDAAVHEEYVTPCESFLRKELYLLWITRLSVVMISQVISAFYKAFGQTFIKDDRFLAVVGAITSVFNCSGRLVYGLIMDRFAYKVAMAIEATLLILLMSTFYVTSLIGGAEDLSTNPCLGNLTAAPVPSALQAALGNLTAAPGSSALQVAVGSLTAAPVPSALQAAVGNLTAAPVSSSLQAAVHQVGCSAPTSLLTKAMFAMWVWAIFFTFPGTFSTQPAVATQTFGHKYGGFIYGFLFTSDIINNLLVATLSKAIKESLGWLALFLIVSGSGIIALVATLFFPRHPRPGPRPEGVGCGFPLLARLGLVELPPPEEEVKPS